MRSYTWDARNRLTAISGAASFAYDGFARRQTATRGGIATSFLYGGWDVAQEQQGGTPHADLLIGLAVDERFARSGATFLTDALGSTLALASAGTVATSYGYDPYGVVQVTGTTSDNPFQYTGRENDGTGLLYYRDRYYSPTWGRLISEDPIGLSGGDVNLYLYVHGSPINRRDPLGLCDQGTPHEYKITQYSPCDPTTTFDIYKEPGTSAPGAPAAQEGYTPQVNLYGNNPISQNVDTPSMTITNTTLPDHIFYPGQVVIQVTPGPYGGSYINITGTGTGDYPTLNNIIGYAFFGVGAYAIALTCSGAPPGTSFF